jgi:hypothetical protein
VTKTVKQRKSGSSTTTHEKGAQAQAAPPVKPKASNAPTTGAAVALRPYKEVGGHHVPAKKAFETPSGYTPGYDPNKALAVPNAVLEDLGIHHIKKLTPAQRRAYTKFAETGKPLTWEAIAQIETDAFVEVGMPLDMAKATVAKAIQYLKDQGVAGPVRKPWNK